LKLNNYLNLKMMSDEVFDHCKGGLLSLDAAEESDKFTTSVVYGTDALARLSLPSLDIFRKKVIDTIFDCRTPKVNHMAWHLWLIHSYKDI